MNEDKPSGAKLKTDKDTLAAAAKVLDRERKRKRRAKVRARKEQRRRELAQHAAVLQIQRSIEVVKWCLVSISTVMLLGIVLGVWTLIAVHDEVERVQAYVADIQEQVDNVKVSLQHPMEAVGGMFGRELDQKLNRLLNKNRVGEE